MPGFKDKFNAITGAEPKERTISDEINDCCPSMTRTQRFYGFGICFVAGWAVSILSSFFVFEIATKPQKFAILYTLGNVIALCSTCFLWGPCKQLKKMFKPIRIVATCIYLTMIVVTFVVAFVSGEPILVILCLIVQCMALIWYAASFIPYGRTIIKKCLSSCFGCKGDGE